MAIRESRMDRVFSRFNFVFSFLFLIIVLYPLIYIVSCSFSDPTLVGNGEVWLWPKGFNVEGYRRVFQDKNIMTGYANTIFYTIVGTALNLAVTLPCGYALSKPALPGYKLIMLYMMIPMYFGGGLVPTYLLVKDLHLLDTRLILVILGVMSVYNMIICRTFFKGIPGELEEAAVIDGCSQGRVFLQIVLPLSQALIGVMVLYYAIGHWNSYFDAMIYVRDNAKKPLQLFLRQLLIVESASQDMMEGDSLYEAEKLKHLLKYSVIIVSSLPMMILYPFLQKYFNKGVLLGSIKG